jgi:hypothetical protein
MDVFIAYVGRDDVFAGVSIGWGENTICRESSRVVEL